jgi:hypothetical protein
VVATGNRRDSTVATKPAPSGAFDGTASTGAGAVERSPEMLRCDGPTGPGSFDVETVGRLLLAGTVGDLGAEPHAATTRSAARASAPCRRPRPTRGCTMLRRSPRGRHPPRPGCAAGPRSPPASP